MNNRKKGKKGKEEEIERNMRREEQRSVSWGWTASLIT